MSKRILIVTVCADLHADRVASKLTALSMRPFRLNLDTFPKDYDINIEFTQNKWEKRLSHIPSQDTVLGEDIGAVWLRKAGDFAFLNTDLTVQEKAYAHEETEHVLSSFIHSLECYWMSHPLALRRSMWKAEQLLRAHRIGFLIPASIITNQPDLVRDFKDGIKGDVIFKPMSSPHLGADKVAENDRVTRGLSTTLITKAHMENLEAVRQVPCCFQEYIPKAYELRVTVVGSKVFAARIYSQEDERTKTDFRDFSADIPYEATQLPAKVEEMCLEFVHSYGLNYGALDLIVTPDGDYVFLENNPAGQFLFVEQLVPELKITDAVTTCLIEGARGLP